MQFQHCVHNKHISLKKLNAMRFGSQRKTSALFVHKSCWIITFMITELKLLPLLLL